MTNYVISSYYINNGRVDLHMLHFTCQNFGENYAQTNIYLLTNVICCALINMGLELDITPFKQQLH